MKFSCSYPSLKLLKKTLVVLEQKAYIAYLIARCGNAVDTYSERKARINVRVYAAAAKHVRVHHSRAQYFNPARSLADAAALTAALAARNVNLNARLCKREK